MGELSNTINVIQLQENAIILSKRTQTISIERKNVGSVVKNECRFWSNKFSKWQWWVSYTYTRSLKPETLLFDITDNKDSDVARSTEVYIRNKTTSPEDTLQLFKKQLLLSAQVEGFIQ